MTAQEPSSAYPENPVVVRVLRAGVVESVHRGAWCLVDPAGEVLAGAGHLEHPCFVRSAVKSLQALALFESGAAERYRFGDAELALASASHSGEACHTECVQATLERLGLGVRHLRCGPHPPTDEGARAELRARREAPSALHNNCSGKHAGFLALAKHLGVPLADYLQPASRGQELVRAALAEMADVPADSLVPGIDGCSAPTYRLPLRALATAFASVTIVERHHEKKRDAPSGSARDTAERLERRRGGVPVPILSVRAPGLYAHQEVLFGAPGETLTLRHDMLGPEAFGPGILAALRYAARARGVSFGLEAALDP